MTLKPKLLKNELFDWAYDTLNNSTNLYTEIYNKNEFFKHLIRFKNDQKINNSNFLWQALCLNRLINDDTNYHFIIFFIY